MPKITIRQTVEADDFGPEVEIVTEASQYDTIDDVVQAHVYATRQWKTAESEGAEDEGEAVAEASDRGGWFLVDPSLQVLAKTGTHDRLIMAEREERTEFISFATEEEAAAYAERRLPASCPSSGRRDFALRGLMI